MKQLLTLLLILFSVSSIFSQSGSLTLPSTTTIKSDSNIYLSDKVGIMKLDTASFRIFNKDVSEVFRMNRKGEILYTPKYFCKCRKCRKFEGMKKLKIKY